jgi:hypothetical protein
MAPKSKKKSETKSESKADPKTEKKSAKNAAAGSSDLGDDAEGVAAAGISSDEAEELEEAAEEAAASSGGGGNAAALAAANGSTDMSASFKNFRHHPDMENFYRFIFENDLRHEALAIIDTIMVDKANRKNAKAVTKTSAKH